MSFLLTFYFSRGRGSHLPRGEPGGRRPLGEFSLLFAPTAAGPKILPWDAAAAPPPDSAVPFAANRMAPNFPYFLNNIGSGI